MSTTALLSFCTSKAQAQATQSDTNDQIVSLEVGARAPFSGMLWPTSRALRTVQRIELLEERLRLDVAVCEDTARLRLSLAEETRHIESERYSSDRASLLVAVRDAERKAERSWWEAPQLWFGMGVVLTVIVVVSIAVALN